MQTISRITNCNERGGIDENQPSFVKQVGAVPSSLQALLASDATGLQLEMEIDFPCAFALQERPAFLRLDHVRLGGNNAVFRSICGDEPPFQGNPGDDLFGFENLSLWSSNQVTLFADTLNHRQGVQAAGAAAITQTITSVPFPLGTAARSRLLLDMFVPSITSGATVSLQLDCDSVGVDETDTHIVSSGQTDQWLTLPFDVSGALPNLASGADDCTLAITVTPVDPTVTNVVRYDHLRFEHSSHCSDYVQLDAAPFALGMSPTPDGSASYPYPLCNAAQIQTVMNTLSLRTKNFVLEADVDLEGVVGQVGTSANPYTGTFDGKNHYLSNYTLSGGGDSAGLFARVTGDGVINGIGDGVIKNLTLADFEVSGGSRVGVLAGHLHAARIENVYVASGKVSSGGPYAGGVVGSAASTSLIEGCVADIEIEGASQSQVGGIVGNLTGSTVRGSRASGTVSAANHLAGIAGYVSGSSIEDCFAAVDVSSSGSYVGGIGGNVVGSAISNCRATGAVASVQGSVGGLAGQLSESTAQHCSASGPVQGAGHIGGLVGRTVDASVSDSWAEGTVNNSGSYSGGLLGSSAAQTTVTRSYATGAVSSSQHSGGLVGSCENTTLQDVYATGDAYASGTSAAGLTASNKHCTVVRAHAVGAAGETGPVVGTIAVLNFDDTGATTFEDSFGASDPNPGLHAVYYSPSEPGAANLTFAEFRDASKFTNWDFFSVWEMGENYPELRKSACQVYEQQNAPPFLVGMATAPNGTALHPYRLCNAEQIVHIMQNPGSPGGGLIDLWDANYLLESDIDLSGIDMGALTYGQIGTNADRFRGTFDGAGRKIKGYQKSFSADYAGLFGRTQGDSTEDGYLDGVIRNLTIEGFEVNGTGYVGALVGYNGGTVQHVQVVEPAVGGTGHYVGGLAGGNGKVIRSSEARNVSVTGGLGSTGGLVGYHFGGAEIVDCSVNHGVVSSSTSSVGGVSGASASAIRRTTSDVVVHSTGPENVGGLVGAQFSATGSPGQIEDCRSYGPVDGKSGTGGLVGRMSGNSTIANSAGHGRVNGTSFVGGLVGHMWGPVNVTASSATGNVEATVIRAGGLVGYFWGGEGTISQSHAAGKVSAVDTSGGFIGAMSGGIVSECTASGIVTGATNYIGGFAGTLGGQGIVSNSVATGGVVAPGANSAVGGFVGVISNAEVAHCAARGDVQGPHSTGGFAGQIREGARVKESASSGNVVGGMYSGGFAGFARGNAALTGCVAVGDVEQTSGNYAGGLIGWSQEYLGGTVSVDECEAQGSVYGLGSYYGGLIGRTQTASVQNSRAMGRVQGASHIGGLIGWALSGTTVLRSSASGFATASGSVSGGLVGLLQASLVSDSYAHGNSTANASAGGMVGNASGSQVRDSYAYGSVSTNTASRGSLVGTDAGGNTIEGVFVRSDANDPYVAPTPSSPAINALVIGLTTEQFKQAGHFTSAGWDFENVWQMGAKAPVHRSSFCMKNEQINVAPFVAGLDVLPEGTKTSPYVICNAAQMQALANTSGAELLGAYFELAQSMDLGSVNGSIGDATNKFVGTFDGKGFELFHFSPTNPGNDSGLFGYVEGDGDIDGEGDGRITNVILVNPSVVSTTATANVGALVGHAVNARIEKIEIIGGTVSSPGANTGGIVGLLEGQHGLVAASKVEVTVNGVTQVGGAVGRLQNGAAIEDSRSEGTVAATTSAPHTAGGLIGHMDFGTLWNSHSTSGVTVNGDYAGGLVGQAHESALAVCSAQGDVSGVDHVGGLLGHMVDTTVARCWATGSVTASGDHAGGLLGSASAGSITDAYAAGSVSGEDNVGGLIGGAAGTSVQRTYATGQVSGSGTIEGALIGNVDGAVHVSGSFGNSTSNSGLSLLGNGSSPGATFLTETQFGDWSNFASEGWTYGTTWVGGSAGPTLVVSGNAEVGYCFRNLQSDAVPFSAGMGTTPNGTADAPWILCTAAQIQTVMNTPGLWGDHFVLQTDIRLAGVTGQIGTVTTPFVGTFDGQGHQLSSYTLTGSGDYRGLFGRVDGSTSGLGRLSNLSLADFDVSGGSLVGTLVGRLDAGSVENVQVNSCTVTGASSVGGVVGELHAGGSISGVTVTGAITGTGSGVVGGAVGFSSGFLQGVTADAVVSSTGNYVGGLVGLNEGGSLSDCAASGAVTGSGQSIGGLVGQSLTNSGPKPAGQITRSTASGNVSGTGAGAVGGLVGFLVDGVVHASSASGDVEGYAYVGGLVGGIAYDDYSAKVFDSSASGDVEGNQAVGGLVGGLVNGGQASGSAFVERSFATGTASASEYLAGGLIGYALNTVVKDTFATGEADATLAYAGALLGAITNGHTINSYATGAATGGSLVGALIGSSDLDSYIFNSFASESVNGGLDFVGDIPDALGVEFASDTELGDAQLFAQAGWDTTNVWAGASGGPALIDQGEELPFCERFTPTTSAPYIAEGESAPAGTLSDPYKLCTPQQIEALTNSSTDWNKHFVLGAHMDLLSVTGRIGSSTTAFTGSLNGAGYLLYDYSDTHAGSETGLFGVVSGNGTTTGIVSRVNLVDFGVNGAGNVGALVGKVSGGKVRNVVIAGSSVSASGVDGGGLVGRNEGTIEHVLVDATVTGTSTAQNIGGVVGYSSGSIARAITTSAVTHSGSGGAHVGGLVGRVQGGTLVDSHAYGNVQSNVTEAGGFAGEIESGAEVESCSAAGNVTINGSFTGAGGLVGRLAGGAELVDCSATGAVNGYQRVGGLVGALGGALVTHSWASGNATGSSTNVGGLVGYISTTSGTTITRSYASGNANGTQRVGGFIGDMLSGTVTNSYAIGNADASSSTGAAGGFIGRADNVTLIDDCYSYGQSDLSSGNTNSGSFIGIRASTTVTTSYVRSTVNPGLPRVGATGSVTGITSRSTTAFQSQSNFSGFDFTNTWIMGAARPELR